MSSSWELGFWGEKIKGGQSISVTPPPNRVLKISSASLEPVSDKSKATLILVDHDRKQEFTVCAFNGQHLSTPLDLFFVGRKVTFKATGEGVVNVLGYTAFSDNAEEEGPQSIVAELAQSKPKSEGKAASTGAGVGPAEEDDEEVDALGDEQFAKLRAQMEADGMALEEGDEEDDEEGAALAAAFGAEEADEDAEEEKAAVALEAKHVAGLGKKRKADGPAPGAQVKKGKGANGKPAAAAKGDGKKAPKAAAAPAAKQAAGKKPAATPAKAADSTPAGQKDGAPKTPAGKPAAPVKTPAKTVKCGGCAKTFATENAMQQHAKAAHKGAPSPSAK